MATYAAYRHVEIDNVGYGKKRVLKPPGGGSSDIFGGAGDEAAATARQVKQKLHQSSFGWNMSGAGGDAHDSATMPNGSGGSAAGSASDTPRSNKPDGNPVTGAGYDAAQHNGGGSAGSSIAGSDKSSTDSSPSVASVPRMKNRVPPGGFSSGLW